MIKQIIRTITLLLSIFLISYLMTSFIEWSLDIMEWDVFGRLLLLINYTFIFGIFIRLGKNDIRR
jgi:hypothetical protein